VSSSWEALGDEVSLGVERGFEAGEQVVEDGDVAGRVVAETGRDDPHLGEAELPVYDWRRFTPAVRSATPQLGRYTIRFEQRARFQFVARNDPAGGLGWK